MDYTFLFSDIEGSTRLWEQYPQAMSAALIRHNEIVNAAVAANKGTVFKTVGDGFYVVFDSAIAALTAAVTIQRELEDAAVASSSIKLRVRIGLYTGPAEARDNDYFGQTLNRVARLMAAANGEQILISNTTKQLTESALPEGIELRDLQLHRFRDVQEPEHVYQVIGQGLADNFSPIKSLSPRSTNLPAQLTSFVGREQDIRAVCDLIRKKDTRLLTLTGPGGIGKTRLSIQIGMSLRDEFMDGVFFVALAPLNGQEALIDAIAQALKLEEGEGQSLLEALKSYLQERHLLLVLDNFEHILEAAPIVNDLLGAAVRLKVLTTSRESLFIYGEHTYIVKPLDLPDPKKVDSSQDLLAFPSAALFVERAQAIEPDFSPTHADLPHIAEICHRLDGLPLAIELAAARLRDLSLEEMMAQLDARLSLLAKGPRDLPSRQQTMRGAVDWSFNLLSSDAQNSFMRLSVFNGNFTVEAAQAVAGEQSLKLLVDKSLLHPTESEDVARFNMLEVLREYALERLTNANELQPTREKHGDYFLSLVERAEPHLTGEQQAEWFIQLEAVYPDLRTALEFELEQNDVVKAARMVAILWRHWSVRSRLSEGGRWMERVLAKQANISSELGAKVTQGAGRLAFLRHEHSKAIAFFQSSLELYKQTDDKKGEGLSARSLGEIEHQRGNNLEAERYYTAALAIYQEIHDDAGMARTLANLSTIAEELGNFAEATLLLKESLPMARREGSPEGVALTLNNLAEVLRAQGDFEEAVTYYRESLEIFRDLDFPAGIAVILHNLGQVALKTNKADEAQTSFLEALTILQESEEKQLIAECFAGLAGALVHHEKFALAVRLLGASKALLDSIEARLSEVDQGQYDAHLNTTRAKMEACAWSAAWRDGQSTPHERILAEIVKDL